MKCGGGGVQVRTRTVTNSMDDSQCPALTDEQECGTAPCPVDCKTTDLKAWGPCSGTCGGGFRLARIILQRPLFGGKTCPPLTENRECNNAREHPCPQDCQVSPWQAWTPCSHYVWRRQARAVAASVSRRDCGGRAARISSKRARAATANARSTAWRAGVSGASARARAAWASSAAQWARSRAPARVPEVGAARCVTNRRCATPRPVLSTAQQACGATGASAPHHAVAALLSATAACCVCLPSQVSHVADDAIYKLQRAKVPAKGLRLHGMD